MSTVVLILVTWRYVALTERLARAQEDVLGPVRAAAQHTAASQVVQLWASDPALLVGAADQLRDELPDLTLENVRQDLKNTARRVHDLAIGILSHSAMLPAPLGSRASRLAGSIMNASTTITAVQTAVLQERNDALQEHREFEMDRVVAAWAMETDRAIYPDWETVKTGQVLRDVDSKFIELLSELHQFLAQ